MALLLKLITIKIILLTLNGVNGQRSECLFFGCVCVENSVRNVWEIQCTSNGTAGEFPLKLPIQQNKPIRSLTIENYNFKEIPSLTFYGMNISHIHLKNNKLERIKIDSFYGLNGLKSLNFYNENYLKSFEKNAFKTIRHTTKVLTMHNCDLNDTEINQLKDELKSLYKLETLNLSMNNLANIDRDLMSAFPELSIIDLSYNSIGNHSLGVFDFNQKLTTIKLKNNKMNDLFLFLISIIRLVKVVEVIDLSNNQFDSIFDLIVNFQNLRILNLAYNRIETNLDQFMFKSLYNLTYLNLSNNKINYLEENTFSFTSQLKVLDLSSNELTNIPNLSNLKKLTHFYFNNQHSKMVELNDNSFDKMFYDSSMMVVNLAENNLKQNGDRPFCTKFTNKKYISYIKIDYFPLSKLDKCLLKQLGYKTNDYNGFLKLVNRTQIVLDVHDPSLDENEMGDVKKYKLVCNCENIKFFEMYNIKLAGVCRALDTKLCTNYIVQEDCKGKEEYICLEETVTTPSPFDRRQKNAAVSSLNFSNAFIFICFIWLALNLLDF